MFIGVEEFLTNRNTIYHKQVTMKGFGFEWSTCFIQPAMGRGKKHSLLDPNHVLATTGKSCSKKKVAFAQIIKGENVILGDFLG